ncbi:MAG TPA: hypothetical protein VHN14_07145 [Kofleriaceae bacterium]|jgi:hypothetical protein|nr:hypothetical protein [Kofleriaceae bacterium]
MLDEVQQRAQEEARRREQAESELGRLREELARRRRDEDIPRIDVPPDQETAHRV